MYLVFVTVLLRQVSGDKWDVYSLAILFAFIFTERHPYPGLGDGQIIHQVLSD